MADKMYTTAEITIAFSEMGWIEEDNGTRLALLFDWMDQAREGYEAEER